jgi:GNAT superfamily N-acetyltransferase
MKEPTAKHIKNNSVWGKVWTRLQRGLLASHPLEAQLYPRLRLPIIFRRYNENDSARCIQIYRLNEPGRFPTGGLAHFAKYLEEDGDRLIVAELDGSIVGFGGLNPMGEQVSCLCYGMVDPEFQRHRIGATLLLLRIAQLKPHALGCYFFIYAVNASLPIYKRFGFQQSDNWKWEDGQEFPSGGVLINQALHHSIIDTLWRRGIRLQTPISTAAKPGAARFFLERDAAGKVQIRRDEPIAVSSVLTS